MLRTSEELPASGQGVVTRPLTVSRRIRYFLRHYVEGSPRPNSGFPPDAAPHSSNVGSPHDDVSITGSESGVHVALSALRSSFRASWTFYSTCAAPLAPIGGTPIPNTVTRRRSSVDVVLAILDFFVEVAATISAASGGLSHLSRTGV
jgi:hypothetical protein